MIFLNIITPCSRVYNLHTISSSINIPESHYRWIVVFDTQYMPSESLIPKNCETYCYKNKNSQFGNYQRNYALDMINEGYVYFNDDDTTIHPKLWSYIRYANYYDFIWFKQCYVNGAIRLDSRVVKPHNIDSHNFIVSYNICKNIRWSNEYEADGIFAQECYNRATSKLYFDQFLSTYNSLRS